MHKLSIYIIYLSVCLSACVYLVTCDAVEESAADCEWEGLKGRCVNPRRCLTTLDDRSDAPPACSEDGEDTLICCTDCELVNDTSNAILSPTGGLFWKDGRIFKDQCLQYLKDLPHKCKQNGFYGGIGRQLNKEKKCHIFSLWAVGGAPPPGAEPPSENPYEALMGFGNNVETALWFTSGAVISDKFILTSAHSHTKASDGEYPLKFAALGVKDRSEDKQNWQIVPVKKIHQHPEFDGGETRYNDIALIELDTPIAFNKNVLPACLPDPDGDFDTNTAKAFSWKDNNTSLNSFVDIPKRVELVNVPAEECNEQISANESTNPKTYDILLPKQIDATTQACYENKEDKPCLNVAGSPLVVNTQFTYCMNTVIGVNAYGEDCGIAVYTKVAPYLPWIQSIVWPDDA